MSKQMGALSETVFANGKTETEDSMSDHTNATVAGPIQPGGARLLLDDSARLLTVDEVATMLGMSTAWVRQHSNGMRQPAIPSVKLGKAVRFRRSQIENFIRSMERVG
jgi:predicted DNA-binding transcriptional regulator AlpA